MQLDRVSAAIRLRRPWEAVDLGFAMARRWWRPLLACWLATFVPVVAALLLLFGDHLGWCLLAIWWLRPLFGLAPQHVLSRALFAEVPGWRESARAAWGQAWRQAPRLLLWRRLDPQRSLLLPVFVLEGTAAVKRRERVSLIGRGLPEASWLTVACSLLEGCLTVALLALAALLVPAGLVDWPGAFAALADGEPPVWLSWALALAWLLAVSVVEPCYTAAGFALYLNRRSLLEGWDVEVTLRGLAARLRRAGAARGRRPALAGGRTAAALLLWLVGLAAPVAGRALPAERDPAAVAAQVLASPDFGETRSVSTWRLRGAAQREEPVARQAAGATLVGGVLELLALAAVAAGLCWVALALLGSRGLRIAAARRAEPPPAQGTRSWSPGGGSARGDLPADVPAAALTELEAGRCAAALGLLYRGALARVAARRLAVPACWTEEQCLAALGEKLPPKAGGYLRDVTLAWQRAAYAHRPTASEQVRELCRRWARELPTAAGGES
jgi:hypothetical protein